MPELPEVEMVKRVVEPQITGRKILQVQLNNEQVLAYPKLQSFEKALRNNTIVGMNRRGKFLEISMENGERITLHFRMTGSLIVAPKGFPEEKHTHIVLTLDNDMELRYVDPRRFGRWWLLGIGEEDAYTGIYKLGLEPFDERLTASYLREKLARRRKAIKECLLDQSVIAGIGNIYGDEILFEAKIYPAKRACDLTAVEWKRMAERIPRVMSFFVEKNAISQEDYLQGRGKEYRNTPFLKVYGHAGEPCACCRTSLQKMKIGGRSSVYCPQCQKNYPFPMNPSTNFGIL